MFIPGLRIIPYWIFFHNCWSLQIISYRITWQNIYQCFFSSSIYDIKTSSAWSSWTSNNALQLFGIMATMLYFTYHDQIVKNSVVVLRDPWQISSRFFSLFCFRISLGSTSCFCWILSWVLRSVLSLGFCCCCPRVKIPYGLVRRTLLPVVKNVMVKAELVTNIWNRYLVDKMPLENINLFCWIKAVVFRLHGVLHCLGARGKTQISAEPANRNLKNEYHLQP